MTKGTEDGRRLDSQVLKETKHSTQENLISEHALSVRQTMSVVKPKFLMFFYLIGTLSYNL